ncbi:MAG: hypothetical protein MR039_01425 [Elusimicrobia bacterium]|nr:hypothetical protein [Elusimicrobiota bacterium]
MKKTLFILATLAMSSALYAQAEAGVYTREKVLELFAQYDPSVLEKARQNEAYNLVLESFASSYQAPQTEQARQELIAVARNFDNSLQLELLSQQYGQAYLLSVLAGNEPAVSRAYFEQGLTPVFANIWAVTVELRRYQLRLLEDQLKQLRKDSTLTPDARAVQKASLKKQIKAVKQELKALQRAPGAQIVAVRDAYVAQVENQIRQQAQAMQAQMQTAQGQAVRQTSNLQVKTNHKKPVAK